MALRYRITALQSTGGDRVTFPELGVTCVVGGNNAGKSQLLREIYARATTGEENLSPLAISAIEVIRPEGSAEETAAWLRDSFIEISRAPGVTSGFATSSGDNSMTPDEIRYWFDKTNQGAAYLGNAAHFFVQRSTAGSLTSYAAGSWQSNEYGASNAGLQYLLKDGDLEEEFSAAILETFNQQVLLDRVTGSTILRVGEITVPVPPLNRPTREYAMAVGALDSLDSQGDGIRSFAGLALQIITGRPNLMLVDEPEAFLHPGQARAVGRWLANQCAVRDIQLIIATHDRDMVLGLIEGGSGAPVNVIRVTREDNLTRLAQLQPEEVRAVWDSPVLRYSNVLQGLFHRKVVICESDGDCRFYGAALDELAQMSGKRSVADDILLVPSGGKSAISTLAAALSHLKVEAQTVVDFDALRNKPELKAIVTSLGATWSEDMNLHYVTFVSAANDGRVDWATLKSAGLAVVPAGPPNESAARLLSLLREVGVHVVPDGEMESFMRTSGLHGPAWVTKALEAGTHKSDAVVTFVQPILV